jgi:hypothetical protein
MSMNKSVSALAVLKRAEEQLRPTSTGWASELVSAGRKATQMLEGLEALAAKRNPTETPEAHAIRVNKAASKVLSQVTELQAKANDIRTAAAQSIAQQIQTRTQLIDGRRGAEIRALFRGMEAKERSKVIEAAVANRDSETLGALFDAPAYLSGMDGEYQSRMRHHYEAQIAPDLHDALDEVLAVDSAVSTVRRVVSEAAQEALNPSYVDRILKDQADAERAQAGFDGTVSTPV